MNNNLFSGLKNFIMMLEMWKKGRDFVYREFNFFLFRKFLILNCKCFVE